MDEKEVILTQEGFDKIEKELEYLRTEKRKEIAERLHKTEDEVKALFSYFDTLSNFERDLSNIDTKSR